MHTIHMLNKLGLGTVQFGLAYGISNTNGQTPEDEVSNILSFAAKNNIQVLDTASSYGEAEKILGDIGVDNFQVVSKYMSTSVAGSIEKQLQQTLTHLKVPNIYAYLAHRPMDMLNNLDEWRQLKQLQEKGLVKKIGFSLNQPQELIALIQKGCEPDIIQAPYNYLDNRFEELMQTLKEKGCEIHSRSVFLQGLFYRNPNSLPAFFDEIKSILASLQSSKLSLPGRLLKVVLQQSFIDKVIVGVETLAQLKENISAIDAIQINALPALKNRIAENILMPALWPK